MGWSRPRMLDHVALKTLRNSYLPHPENTNPWKVLKQTEDHRTFVKTRIVHIKDRAIRREHVSSTFFLDALTVFPFFFFPLTSTEHFWRGLLVGLLPEIQARWASLWLEKRSMGFGEKDFSLIGSLTASWPAPYSFCAASTLPFFTYKHMLLVTMTPLVKLFSTKIVVGIFHVSQSQMRLMLFFFFLGSVAFGAMSGNV